MITGKLLESLTPGAAFISTARGAVVDQDALGEVLAKRSDIHPQEGDNCAPDTPSFSCQTRPRNVPVPITRLAKTQS
jgi:hypothetical protein